MTGSTSKDKMANNFLAFSENAIDKNWIMCGFNFAFYPCIAITPKKNYIVTK